MSQSFIPSFSDITIWPYVMQVKGGQQVRVNAPDPRQAQRKAILRYRKGTKVGAAEAVVLTAEQMHRILGIDSVLTADEQRELAGK
jgi:hypothetical protein